jgi:hypothetical protein
MKVICAATVEQDNPAWDQVRVRIQAAASCFLHVFSLGYASVKGLLHDPGDGQIFCLRKMPSVLPQRPTWPAEPE